jgi:hypothetical protein
MQMIDMQGVSKLRVAAGDARLGVTQMRFAFLDLKNSNSDDTRPEATGPPPNAATSLRFAAHSAPKDNRDRRILQEFDADAGQTPCVGDSSFVDSCPSILSILRFQQPVG